ncbi:hypothetical protein AGRO_0720 [Agrobacterium sp. ATCC 31749]|nr:hypothetical protein AGRO_0720 [Agrobacterium sp. ATCC 31749]
MVGLLNGINNLLDSLQQADIRQTLPPLLASSSGLSRGSNHVSLIDTLQMLGTSPSMTEERFSLSLTNLMAGAIRPFFFATRQ